MLEYVGHLQQLAQRLLFLSDYHYLLLLSGPPHHVLFAQIVGMLSDDGTQRPTLRMHKEDYVNVSLGYRKAEWRSGIWVSGAKHLLIENIAIENTGGDGIYLNTYVPCDTPDVGCRYWPYGADPGAHRIPSDIVLRGVRSLYNYRQGFSLIAVNGLVVEDCHFSFTGHWPPDLVHLPNVSAATAPAAGIDMEPNAKTDTLQNISLSGCTIRANVGGGISISPVPGHVSIRVEQCELLDNEYCGFIMSNANGHTTGQVEVVNTTVTNTFGPGIWLYTQNANGSSARFKNVTLDNCAYGRESPIFMTQYTQQPLGALTMQNLTVIMAANYSSVDRSGMNGFLYADSRYGVQDINISGRVVASTSSECVPVDLFDQGHYTRCNSTIDCVLKAHIAGERRDDAVLASQHCVFEPHRNRIGPDSQQLKRDEFTCSTKARCPTEAAKACNAALNCSSFGISPKWHAGALAQLYSTAWNRSIPDSGWTLYTCTGDGPPPGPPLPPPPPSPPVRPPSPPLAPVGSCKTTLDCSLNGVCEPASGACVCDAPWKHGSSGKEACNVFDVLPHPDDYVPAYGSDSTKRTAFGPQNSSTSITSWGGNIIHGDDGKYHLWVSAMGDGHGLSGWGSISQIDHAVAAGKFLTL